MTVAVSRSVGAATHAQALARPDALALRVGGRDLGYAELDDTARRWASRLVEAVGGRPGRVGVFAHRSEASYVGVLAALYAGAAFVPLNRKYPLQRTRTMVERADLDAVIVDDASLPQAPALLAGLPRQPVVLAPGDARPDGLDAPTLTRADLAAAGPLDALAEPGPDEVAYLLFTSGSTGEPKGVPVTHGNVRAFLDVNHERYRLMPEDRLTQTFDQTFDLSVFDLFMAWESGAAVCSMEPIELLAPFGYLTRNQITVWFSVPSAAAALARRGALTPNRMPTLRWSLFCGEALPASVAQAWQRAAPGSVVENLYGPTELTIACAAHRWDPRTSPARCVRDTVPIGRLYPKLHALVVDERLTPAPDGQAGELCVAGPQTTPGYWRAPELTARRYFQRDGRVYYRTGDLVRREHGEFVFLGRNDQQVKIGGYRVELGEVEAALRRGGCDEAVCLLWPDAGTITAVVAGAAAPQALADAVAARLPGYMRPRSVRAIDAMPVNDNGKVDRNAVRSWLDARADHA